GRDGQAELEIAGDHRLDADRARRVGDLTRVAGLLVESEFGGKEHGQEGHVRRRGDEAHRSEFRLVLRSRSASRAAEPERCGERGRYDRSEKALDCARGRKLHVFDLQADRRTAMSASELAATSLDAT